MTQRPALDQRGSTSAAHWQATILRLTFASTAYLASMFIVFRDAILSNFDLGFGDRADAIIEISILEHWRSAFLGLAGWRQTFYFHPYADTLGYNDGYFVSGVIYAGWRLFFDPFLADTMTAFTFKSVGYVATLWLVRRVLRWDWGTAILIATLATISNNMYLQSVHAQIQTMALLPIVIALAIIAVRLEADDRRRASMAAALGAGLMGLWLVTSFYFACFTIYFAIVLVACWLWLTGRWRPAEFMMLARAHWRTGAVFAGAFVLAAVPFLLVYAPKAIETGGHGFVLSYTVQPTDLVNTGERNLIWGWIVRALSGAVHAVAPAGGRLEKAMLGGEHEAGFPLLLLALTFVSAHRLIRRRGDRRFARVFALAIVISWALTLRIWQVSPWILVHYLVPAAAGLRVVLRYQLFLVLPVLLLVGTVFRVRFVRLRQRRPWLAAGIVVLLVLEQINVAQPAHLSRTAQLAAFDAVPPPPAACRAFYVVVVRPGEAPYVDQRLDALYPHNVDAMFLAERWRRPTLNGFSTFNPPDWNFARPYAADYDARVVAYAKRHRLSGLCRLDMRNSAPWTIG